MLTNDENEPHVERSQIVGIPPSVDIPVGGMPGMRSRIGAMMAFAVEILWPESGSDADRQRLPVVAWSEFQ